MANKKTYYAISYTWRMANGCAQDEYLHDLDEVQYQAELAMILNKPSVIRVTRLKKVGSRAKYEEEDVYYPHGNYRVMNGIIEFFNN